MALRPEIILGAQQPNLVGAIASGEQAAQLVNQRQQQNQLADLFRTQGAGILSGDTNALAALAGIDPSAALGIQTQQQQAQYASNADSRAQQAFQLDQQATRQRMGILNQQEARAAQDYAAGLSAQQAAAEAAQIENAVKTGLAIQDPTQWDQIMSQQAPDLVGQFANRDALAARYMSVAEVLKMRGGGETFRPATPQEAAQYGSAGGQFGPDGRFYPVNPPSGFEITTGPDGRQTIRQGAGVGSGQPDIGLSPSSPTAMISSIDGILSDPALDYSTGALAASQNIPGTPMYRFGARANQLEGQAFLQAFESLKGGGAITEIEGQKATQAIGRLSSAQSPADYRAALGELRATLVRGEENKRRIAAGQPPLDENGNPFGVQQPAQPEPPNAGNTTLPPPAVGDPNTVIAPPAQPAPPSADGWTTLENGTRIRRLD